MPRFSSDSIEMQLAAQIRAVFAFDESALPRAPDAGTWRSLLNLADQHGLQGLLAARMEMLPPDEIPADVFANLQDQMRRSTLAQALAYRELDALSDFCTEQHIEFVVLKGAALARTLYPRMTLRPFGDIDLLIRQHDAPILRRFLLGRGMEENPEIAPGFRRAYMSETSFFSARGTAVDLHWRLVMPAYYQRYGNIEWFWENAEAVTLSGRTMRILNPTAQLVHLCAHLGLHHQDRVRLIWMLDVALLLKLRGGEIRWQEANKFTQGARLTRPARNVLDETCAVWGVTLPPETETMFRANPLDLNERMAYALTTANFTEARIASDLLNLDGLGKQIDFARRYLFPHRDYMRIRYRIRHAALMPLYYLWRPVESAFKFVRSLGNAITPGKK